MVFLMILLPLMHISWVSTVGVLGLRHLLHCYTVRIGSTNNVDVYHNNLPA